MRNRSIKFKMSICFTLILVATVALAFFTVRSISKTVLSSTIRNYLIATVEENTGKINYIPGDASSDAESPGESESDGTTETPDNVYISFAGGKLEIDLDFLDIVNEVYAALYDEQGEFIYGEAPSIKGLQSRAPTETMLWSLDASGDKYEVYDRRLNIEGLPDGKTLWIRGVVSTSTAMKQLGEMSRLSFTLLPFILIVAIAFAYFLTRKLLSPIADIQETASRISNGEDLGERIPVGKSNDEVGRLARVFNGMLDKLEQSFASERQFTSDASHELRTPASVISAQTEYTLERDRSVEEYKEALLTIKRQSERMNLLIDDMLNYTRLDQSPERYPMERINLSELTADISEQMKLIPEKNIQLAYKVMPEIFINGNALLLTRMIQNLIGNSYRYGNEGGHINVTLESDDSRPVLTIADDGAGIAEEDLPNIFNRFYRGDDSRNTPGTGLGLSMVKRIAELHGAEVRVDSKKDFGTTFKIIFASNVPLIKQG